MIQCQLEEHVPIPTRLPEAGAIESVRAKAAAACKAAAMLCMEGYDAPAPAEEDLDQGIKDTLAAVAEGRPTPRTFNELISTPVGAIRINAVLTQYDMEVVNDSKRLRRYITNRLVLESDNFDAKVRLKALEMLGKITDVGLFTERSEITLTQKSTSELETILKEKLRRFLPNGGSTTGDGTTEYEDAVIVPNTPVKLEADISAMLR